MTGKSTLKIAFWNIGWNKKNDADAQKAQESLNRLLNAFADIDLLLVAESPPAFPEMNGYDLIGQNNQDPNNILSAYYRISKLDEMEFLAKDLFQTHQFTDDNNSEFRALYIPYLKQYLIVMVHFPSLLNQNRDDHLAYSIEFNRELRGMEDHFFGMNARQTIIMGDFNVNPYDASLLFPSAFNAPYAKRTFYNSSNDDNISNTYGHFSSHRILKKNISNPYFYNPMWYLMGQANINQETVQGSYFKPKRSFDDIWRRRHNFLDQVLIRPNLMLNFELKELKICDEINGSDHYPLICQLINLPLPL